MLSETYYAHNYVGIIGLGLHVVVIVMGLHVIARTCSIISNIHFTGCVEAFRLQEGHQMVKFLLSKNQVLQILAIPCIIIVYNVMIRPAPIMPA